MDQIMTYVKPELMIVSFVLFFLGSCLKNSEVVPDKFIPIINGAAGIVLCAVYVISTTAITSTKDISMAIFTALTQGILAAGLSTYINQLDKQLSKKE